MHSGPGRPWTARIRRDHFRAGELAEFDARIARLHGGAHVEAEAGHLRQGTWARASWFRHHRQSPRPWCPTSRPAPRSAGPAATNRIAGQRKSRAPIRGASRRAPRCAPRCCLFADLAHAAEDHVLDRGRIDAGAIHQRVHDPCRQIRRMPAGKRPPLRPPAVRAAATI